MARVPLYVTAQGDGNAFPVRLNGQEYHAMSATADSSWYFRGLVPDDYGSAPNIEIVVLANATANVHRLNIEISATADGEAGAGASLTALTFQGVTVPGTAYLEDRVTFDASSVTFAAGDRIQGRVLRDGDGSGGTDSLTVPTLLSEVWFSYTAA